MPLVWYVPPLLLLCRYALLFSFKCDAYMMLKCGGTASLTDSHWPIWPFEVDSLKKGRPGAIHELRMPMQTLSNIDDKRNEAQGLFEEMRICKDVGRRFSSSTGFKLSKRLNVNLTLMLRSVMVLTEKARCSLQTIEVVRRLARCASERLGKA